MKSKLVFNQIELLTLLLACLIFPGCPTEYSFSQIDPSLLDKLPTHGPFTASPVPKIPGSPSIPSTPSSTPSSPPKSEGDGTWVEVTEVRIAIVENTGAAKVVKITGYLGLVSMEALSDDVLEALGNPPLPKGTIKRILIMTSNSSSKVVENGVKTCSLDIPSGESSGIKIQPGTPISSDQLKTQKLTFPFSIRGDDGKNGNVVFRGNGRCNLHPQYRPATEPTSSPSGTPVPTRPTACLSESRMSS